MSEAKITTNHHWRQFVYRCDVPQKILDDQFDHLDTDAVDNFFKYRGVWYHLSDFERNAILPAENPLNKFHGFHAHGAFSATGIIIDDDCEAYQIATVTW